MNEDKMIKKLEEHNKRFDEHSDRLDVHGVKLNAIISKLDEHDTQFKELQDQIAVSRSENLTYFEEIMGKLNKMDDERLALVRASRRHQDHLEQHDKDIKKLKTVLELAD